MSHVGPKLLFSYNTVFLGHYDIGFLQQFCWSLEMNGLRLYDTSGILAGLHVRMENTEHRKPVLFSTDEL